MRNPFRRKPKLSAIEPVDLGPDPHGDGTIRPGDPLWEAMTSGEAILANRRDDGTWDVQRFGGAS